MDYSLPLRRAVLIALKANPGVLAVIPKASLYPSVVPTTRTFPFMRYGAPNTTPFRLSGLNSSSSRFALHGFNKSTATVTAEDGSYKIAAAFQSSLDGAVLPIEGGMRATITWLGSNCLIDGDETDSWHSIANFAADIAG